jgi:hypothetical protein
VAGCWFVSGLDDATREDLLALIGVQQRIIDELRAEVAETQAAGRDELLEQFQPPVLGRAGSGTQGEGTAG